jgi:hypothetical protein
MSISLIICIIIIICLLISINPSYLISKAYDYGQKAEYFRRKEGFGSTKSILNDEEGIKCLRKAVFFSIFRKAQIKKILIRVCIGVAQDYLQNNDFNNSIRISEIIYKYGKTLNLHGTLGSVEKPTLSGRVVYEPLDPLVKELKDYFIEKNNSVRNITENEKEKILEIYSKLSELISLYG